MVDESGFLTLEQAAARAGKSLQTIRNWVRAGLLKRYRKPLDKRIYVRADELARLLEGQPKEEES